MRITIDRGGGFFYFRKRMGPIDTGSLGDAGVAIEAKVAEIGFFDLPEKLGEPNPSLWRQVTVEDGDRSHSVFCPSGSPVAAEEALAALETMLQDAGGGFEFLPRAAAAEEWPGEEPGLGWGAWYDRMPGVDDPRLHVAGVVRLRSSSAVTKLELDNIGTAPEPAVTLRLTIEYPDVGTDDMEDRPVTWAEDVGPDIERVRIIGDDEADIDVTIAT